MMQPFRSPRMFCTMLGKQGVLDSGRYSILSPCSNYQQCGPILVFQLCGVMEPGIGAMLGLTR